MKNKKNTETPRNFNSKVNIIQMNNYVKPNPRTMVTQSSQYITNGTDNSYFRYVEDRYLGSTTNAAIIGGFVNYIYADGLRFKDQPTMDISKILSKSDARLIVQDLKMQAAFALQVIYTKDRSEIAKLMHVPVKELAIVKQENIYADPVAYWWTPDWENKSKYKPIMIPAFGMSLSDDIEFPEEILERGCEIAYFRLPSPQPLYSLPDYQSCLEWCETEEEVSHATIKNAKNKFSAGGVVNINQGGTSTPEAQEEAEAAILNKVKGTSNQGNVIVSFNDNKENETTWVPFDNPNAWEQWEGTAKEAKAQIMLGHKVNDPALFGLPMPSGFSSQADQLDMSLKILYRNRINPFREVILDGLEKVLAYGGNDLKLEFIDFPSLNTTNEDKPSLDNAISGDTQTTQE